jgi:hypothetical protein
MPRAWLVGRVFACDEQTMGFQGKHVDKRRITYKKEGDGFQADVLAQDGWTHQVYLRNEPAPKEYLRMGLCPLHARVLWLFGCLKSRWHVCGVDNLYTSAKFLRVSYVTARVLINGVTRTSGRGLPPSIIQEAITNKKEQMKVRGTVKAAVLVGDVECPNVVATSVYDTKPVHFLSSVCESIKWIIKERLVFNVDTGRTEVLKFLRLDMNDFYNNSMGHVDVSDQLRNQYRFDHWLRMRKWWWALYFWWLGVMMVNAYVFYVKMGLLAGVERKNLLSHHDFRQAIALAWIDPVNYHPGYRVPTREEPTTPPPATALFNTPPVSMSGKRTRKLSSKLTDDSTTPKPKKKSRSLQFTDKTLAVSGILSIRLESTASHLPVPSKPDAKCQMHRWVGFPNKRSDLMSCEDCHVSICVQCYKRFHTVQDLVAIKGDLYVEYKEDSDKNSRTGARGKT